MLRTQDQSLPLEVLIPHFGKETNLVGVEIGVSGGVGSFGMLYYLPNLKLYCIDPWLHIDGAPAEAGLAQEIHDEGYATALLRVSPYKDRVTLIRKQSDAAVNDVPDVIDFVHIDGDHRYEQVVRDIKNYMPKIRSGGLISGHDYILQESVVRAVHETFPEGSIKFADDFVWWVAL